jgi:beta-hydroxylase
MCDSPNIFNNSLFSWASELENSFDIIKKELLELISDQSQDKLEDWFSAHPHYVEGVEKISWKTFDLIFFGITKKSNAERCPETYSIMQNIPNLVTAQFSLLKPRTHITPHKGYSKMLLRAHLPIVVPAGDKCMLQVEEEKHFWKEGELVVFDDSKLHEAWNNSDETRIVLMFDFAKPSAGYTAEEICKYKIERIDDPFLLEIANKSTWAKWLKQGFFDE